MFVMVVIASGLVAAMGWGFKAQIVPVIVGVGAFIAASISLFNDMCRKPDDVSAESLADETQRQVEKKIHMDMTSDTGHLPVGTVAKRGAIFFTYLIAFMASMATIGLIPTAFFFVIIFMRIEGPEPWPLVLTYAVAVVVFIVIAFDKFMAVPWPQTLLGTWFPFFKIIPSV
jgi:Tripartite tricarboxylate transporter TctB family